ncbi:hypothetical protein PI124_g3456 [Phytophthora idaei]|nr:hypothetical protein PI124_g3456 [Phytophthora idaei]
MPSASTADAHAFFGQGVPVADTSMFQQLFAMMAQQNQTFQSAIQAQMQQTQMQMQQAQAQFEQLILQQGGRNRKTEPTSYEGKIDDDLELWIFATEEYYASNRALMIADSSDFVTMVSSNLGTTVLNWNRAFSAQYLLSQTEIPISEREKRFYFQHGLHTETSVKIKEESPVTLAAAVEQATNFEFAHFDGKAPKNSGSRKDARHDNAANSTSISKKEKATNKAAKTKNDWKKEATCHKCGLKGHISPDCKTDSNAKEVNHYVRGSLYASLEVQAQAYREAADKKNVAIFVDNGSSLNGISEELTQVLDLEIQEAVDNMMEVDLGFGQSVRRPRRTAEMILDIPGFPSLKTRLQIMPIPEHKDVLLGMIWLREQNPDIDWQSLTIAPRFPSTEQPFILKTPPVRPAWFVANRRHARQRQRREILNFYRQHGHDGRHGHTKIISVEALTKELRKGKTEVVFIVNPHDSEKAARFNDTGTDLIQPVRTTGQF